MTSGLAQDGFDTPNERGERVTLLDQALWAALKADRPDAAFASAWLTLQCRQLKDALRAVLVLRDPNGKLVPVARWPDGDGGSATLNRTVELCLEHGRGVANVSRAQGRREANVPACFAYPIIVEGETQGVVSLEAAATADAAAREFMGGLHWGTAWLELAVWRQRGHERAEHLSRATTALEIVSMALAAESFEDQARVAATEIANRTGATRVSIGWVRRRAVRIVALSHGVAFSRRMNLVSRLAAAMDETVDQAQTVSFPAPAGATTLITRAHETLVEAGSGGAVLSVPFAVDARILGVLLVEYPRAAMLDQPQVDLLETLAALLSPALDRFRAADRSIFVHAAASARDFASRLLGSGHLALKLATLAALGTIAFFGLFRTEYRVSGRATIEGEVRRTIAASLDGYVASENARAGQTVKKDAPLATLDATEFMLQRLRWIAVREQHQLELSKNLAAGQRADVNILRAQIDEANAQIALLDDQISRTHIVAPFDGIILSGDLSQSVGAPVQRAQVLFEIAPLNAYRVVVRVPDSEIGRIVPGREGAVVLSALPEDRFAYTVTTITPVTEVSEGENAFRVEGRLDRISERLRPNMEGVARTNVGNELLIWIWTHRLVAAVRLALWSWWP